MPTIGAMTVATLASYLVGDLISGFASLPVQMVAGAFAFYAVYFPVRRWLVELRGT
ncbi:MAG: hypothetical protein K1Y01_16375 [Vicinamibacteria bacterium]|nr:hypothetical protein [Vicinamibacteria bacterium]